MDSKGAAAAVPTQVYEDFVPTTELVQEQDSDTLLLNLTGFKKEQVRVQLTKSGILKISGQRPVGQIKWLRFQKDFPVSENCDKNKISAKFENGILYVKQPKLITSAEKKDNELPTPDTQQPKKPADHEQQADDEPKSQDLPKQANAENAPAKEPETEEPKPKTNEQTTEANDLPGKAPAEKSETVEDGKKPSYDSKRENDTNIGTGVALAAKLKMPRKVMNMTLIALLVLGIGLYISNMMKSNNYQAEE